jgi:hypothetical protein
MPLRRVARFFLVVIDARRRRRVGFALRKTESLCRAGGLCRDSRRRCLLLFGRRRLLVGCGRFRQVDCSTLPLDQCPASEWKHDLPGSGESDRHTPPRRHLVLVRRLLGSGLQRSRRLRESRSGCRRQAEHQQAFHRPICREISDATIRTEPHGCPHQARGNEALLGVLIVALTARRIRARKSALIRFGRSEHASARSGVQSGRNMGRAFVSSTIRNSRDRSWKTSRDG